VLQRRRGERVALLAAAPFHGQVDCRPPRVCGGITCFVEPAALRQAEEQLLQQLARHRATQREPNERCVEALAVRIEQSGQCSVPVFRIQWVPCIWLNRIDAREGLAQTKL
jgi:hypothetical protein